MLHERAELIEIANEKLEAAGLEPIEYVRPPLLDDAAGGQ